jgi:hypothetical protein
VIAPELELIIFSSLTGLIAYDKKGLRWGTRRLAWDGLEVTSITNTKITGRSWDVSADEMRDFTIELVCGDLAETH